jgi:hypothetical protein
MSYRLDFGGSPLSIVSILKELVQTLVLQHETTISSTEEALHSLRLGPAPPDRGSKLIRPRCVVVAIHRKCSRTQTWSGEVRCKLRRGS